MRVKAGEQTLIIDSVNPADVRRLGANIGTLLARGGRRSVPLQVFSGRRVRAVELSSIFSKDDLMLLERCGLFQFDGSFLSSEFRVHLVGRLLIFTDADVPDEEQSDTYLDPLWEAPYLVKMFVRGRVRTALDVGCGCGVLSLFMAGYGERVVGTDLNPRAVMVSRFNAAVNGLHNVLFLEGDLFAPVRGEQFERIVFNSPTGEEEFKSDGLLRAGEGILRRFFSETHEMLSPTGYCQVNLAMNDYPHSRFRERLGQWIQPDSRGYQILLLILSEIIHGPGHTWKRGWLTLRRGPECVVEMPCKYDEAVDETAPDDFSSLIVKLLDDNT